ncbi:uncharacterized protein [Asterias amurensis]|uniref:uncharacterized protein n=1 Tax=Asterias amurensis TaxID=7602 RepID=UPI003AB75B06
MTSMLNETEQEVQPPSQGSVSKCSKHTNKDVIMYCDPCKQLICTSCIAKDHRKHHTTELNEVLDNCKKKADEILAAVGQHHNSFKTAIVDIGRSRELLEDSFKATKAKISKKAVEKIAEETARIKDEENKLMVELDRTYKDKAKEMETARTTNNNDMKKAQNMNVIVNQNMCIKLNFCKNLHLIEKRLQDLKDYTDIHPKRVHHDLAYIDFEDDQKSLGRLRIKEDQKLEGATSASATPCELQTNLTQETWKKKKEITSYKNRYKQMKNICASEVASYCNGEVVVFDLKDRTLIKVSASQSKVTPKELPIEGLINPRKVHVNKNDELIVVDDTAVKIFNRKYKCLHQFTLGGHPAIQPSCIAVDDNNLIAVGYDSQGQISLLRQNGSIIATLPAPGIGKYLTIHKQQLIYTKRQDKKLESMDYNSHIVFSVDINHNMLPCGLCCDKDGSIFVGTCIWDKEPLSSEIQHYRSDGVYIGCIIKGCAYPYGITITPAGDLVVATDESVQIYCNE